MEEARLLLVVGFGVGIIVTVIVLWMITSQKEKNVEILTRNDMKKFRLPDNDKRLKIIFTKNPQEARIEFAEELLKQYQNNYSRAERRLETEQEEFDDLMRELNKIQKK